MNLLLRLLEIGITESLSDEQKYKIRLLNKLAVYSIVLILPFFVLHILNDAPLLIFLVTATFVANSLLILYFNYKKRYKRCNYITAYLYPLSFVLSATYFGIQSQVEYYMLLSGISSSFLFEKNSSRITLMAYVLFLFFIIKAFFVFYPNGLLVNPYLPNIHFFNGGIILIIAFLVSNNIISNQEKLTLDLKEKNEEISKLNATLEEKVEERTKEIEQKSKALALSNQEIKSFSYIAAHDMREPLRNIIGFTRLMNKDIVKRKYDKIDEYSGYIDWSVRRIDALTRDIVDYTNLEEKIKQTSLVDLNDVIYDAILVSFERRKDAEFEVDALPVLNVNQFAIKLLFKELIENAIQYCDQPQPSIKINYKELPDVHQFSVEDNGIGIEKKYHRKIFKMFKRLQNDIQQDGSGIGLSICNKVVQGYHGNIWLKSELGKGSTFYFSIPK